MEIMMDNEELAKLLDEVLAGIADYESIVSGEEMEEGRSQYTHGELAGLRCAKRAVMDTFREHGVK